MLRASQLLRSFRGDRLQQTGRTVQPIQQRIQRQFQRRSSLESLESRLALTVWYVDANNLGSGDGATWDSAFGDLQDALAASEHGDEIWIADGIYTPTQGFDRTRSFAIPDGVSLYGGFAGGETTREERDPAAHFSTLSGDIGVTNQPGDNSHHVVTVAASAHVTMDGVVVSEGYADGTLALAGAGGGIVNLGALQLRGARISGNRATNGAGVYNAGTLSVLGGAIEGNQTLSGGFGGGIYAADSSTTIRNAAISHNSADYRGGGIAVEYGSLEVVDSVLEGNATPGDGGAIYIGEDSSVSLVRSSAHGNSANDGGGAWFDEDVRGVIQDSEFVANAAARNGGGVLLRESLVDFTHTLISQNAAGQDGGGLYSAATQLDANHVTLHGNQAGRNGGGAYLQTSRRSQLSNSTVNENRTADGGNGGGLFIALASIGINNTTITGNSAGESAGAGGGLFAGLGFENPTLRANIGLSEVTIANNTAADTGGGIQIGAGVDLDVADTVIAGNSAGDAGGGILTANLTTPVSTTPRISLDHVIIQDNTAPFGAGLCNGNNQSVELTNSRILTNTAREQGAGGINDSGYLRLVGTEIRGNRLVASGAAQTTLLGAGFLNRSFGGTATLVLDGVQIVDNQIIAHAASVAEAFGAGLANLADDSAGIAPARAEVLMNLGQVSQNRAEAKTGEGDASELFARSYGGGIFSTTFGSTASALVSLNRATVDGNIAYATNAVDLPSSDESPYSIGGGIFADGDSSVIVNLSTVSANRADAVLQFADNSYAYGGGIAFASLANGAKLDVLNSTISGNVAEAFSEDDTIASGGGIIIGQPWTSHQQSQATAAVISSTVVFNRAASFGSDKRDVSGGGIAVDSRAYPAAPSTNNSLVAVNCDLTRRSTDAACSSSAGVAQGIDSLAFNGGPTKTHGLLVGSPWIDAGDPAYNAINTTDQRGQPRLLDGNGDSIARIDMGAYEYSTTFLFGDLDHSGKVEIPDALFIQRNFGATSATYAQGDLNADGRIDAADVGALVHHLGKRLPLAAAASATVMRAARTSAAAVEAPRITVRRRALAPAAVDEALSGRDRPTAQFDTAPTEESNRDLNGETTILRARRRPARTL